MIAVALERDRWELVFFWLLPRGVKKVLTLSELQRITCRLGIETVMESNENCMKSTWRVVRPRCVLQVGALTADRAAVMAIGHYLKCVLALSARC